MEKRRSKNSKNKKSLILIVVLVIAVLVAIFGIIGNKTSFQSIAKIASRVLGAPNTEGQAVESISMESNESYEDKVPGSWHLDKSAEWTDIDKARITFDVSSVMKTELLGTCLKS